MKSGVPQKSVLVSIMFLVYVSDMTEAVSSYLSLFADDAKLLRKIRNYTHLSAIMPNRLAQMRAIAESTITAG